MAKQSRISHLSDAELTAMTTREIAAAYYDGNNGAAWNALNARGLKGAPSADGNNGNAEKPIIAQKRATATTAYLPGRVADWAMKKLGMDPDDGDTIPDGFSPEDFLALPDVATESVNYLRLISRLEPEKELNPFRLWLGTGLTRAERALEAVQAAIARIAKIDAAMATSESRFESSRYDAAITAFYAE